MRIDLKDQWIPYTCGINFLMSQPRVRARCEPAIRQRRSVERISFIINSRLPPRSFRSISAKRSCRFRHPPVLGLCLSKFLTRSNERSPFGDRPGACADGRTDGRVARLKRHFATWRMSGVLPAQRRGEWHAARVYASVYSSNGDMDEPRPSGRRKWRAREPRRRATRR